MFEETTSTAVYFLIFLFWATIIFMFAWEVVELKKLKRADNKD